MEAVATSPTAAGPAKAKLETVDEPFEEHNFSEILQRPPFVALDLEAQVAMSWDPKASCLIVQPLCIGGSSGRRARVERLFDVAAPRLSGEVHLVSDMDSPFASLRHGNVWVLGADGKSVWASDRTRYRAQDRFLKLLGHRLQEIHGMPRELWLGRVRPMLLPWRRRQSEVSEEAQESLN